jgi:NADH:ubiquinone oxidoreductase subunit D
VSGYLEEDGRYVLNFGPHHPSTHGVLRLVLTLRGEDVLDCAPDIGYLHRGVEKIVEQRKFISIIPYVDRLDYLSSLIMEHTYVLALEKLLDIEIPMRAQYIRIIMDELTRISSHLMAIGTMTFDLGCLSLFLYCLEEREKILEIFEEVTGARMHQAYYFPGGVLQDISAESIKKIKRFIEHLNFFYESTEKLALNNRIFIERTKSIGVISTELAKVSGISGVNLRASGIDYDVREYRSYGAYHLLDYYPMTLQDGDCYARFYLRFLEIKQSTELITQCLEQLEPGEFYEDHIGFDVNQKGRYPIQKLLHDYVFANGIQLPSNKMIYSACESPRGEFGVHLFMETNPAYPYRLRFKSPSFLHIQLLKKLLPGVKLADCPAILSSLDFLMGDCDR